LKGKNLKVNAALSKRNKIRCPLSIVAAAWDGESFHLQYDIQNFIVMNRGLHTVCNMKKVCQFCSYLNFKLTNLLWEFHNVGNTWIVSASQ
jgi:hypothetical protein